MSLLSTENNIFGYVAPGWESVQRKFEQNLKDGHDIGGSLCIYYRGGCVVNLIGGWKDAKTKQEPYTPDTLQLVFSTSKGVAAAAAALCVEKGWLDYQEPVVKYWPEFGANEKEVRMQIFLTLDIPNSTVHCFLITKMKSKTF